jgi:hypothetical protein
MLILALFGKVPIIYKRFLPRLNQRLLGALAELTEK